MGDYLGDYGELCSFANIKYTPAWYYKQFPGFFNVDSYRILANWQDGVRTEDQYAEDMKCMLEQGLPEFKESEDYSINPIKEEEDELQFDMESEEMVLENKKRKLEDEKQN